MWAVSVQGGERVVPGLSGLEKFRVTISLMREGRRTGCQSWAGSCVLRLVSWPGPRTLLSRVCGETERV